MKFLRCIVVFLVFAATFQVKAEDERIPYTMRIGGSGMQRVLDIAADPANGDIIAVGVTTSVDMPGRDGAYQATNALKENGFVMRFNADCTLLKFTVLIGGSEFDEIRGVAISSSGDILLTGSTMSGVGIGGFPTTKGAFDTLSQKNEQDAFFAILSGDGKNLLYSSMIGGEKSDRASDIIALRPNVFVVCGETESLRFPGADISYENKGLQGFVAVIYRENVGNESFAVSSYLIGGREKDYCTSVARISNEQFAVTGATSSSDFPVTESSSNMGKYKGKLDAFAAVFEIKQEIKPIAVWLIGGKSDDIGRAIAYNGENYLAIAGTTASEDFILVDKPEIIKYGGKNDAFATICAIDGTVKFSTYLGGSEADTASYVGFSEHGDIIVAGSSASWDFPFSGLTTEWLADSYSGQNDGFVSVFSPFRHRLLYSSMFGGTKNDATTALAIGDRGKITIAGSTNSSRSSFSPSTINSTIPNNFDDGFLIHCDLRPDLFSYQQKIQFPDTFIGDAVTDTAIIIATGINFIDFQPFIAGDPEGNFTLQKDGEHKLSAREIDTLIVVFAPKSSGIKNATLMFATGSENLRPKIALSGIGKNAILSTNLPLIFEPIEVGLKSAPKIVRIKNLLANECHIDSLFLIGQDTDAFSIQYPPSRTIPSGKSVEIPIIFSPTIRGQHQCNLLVKTTIGNIRGLIKGTGIGAELIASEKKLAFDTTSVGASNNRYVEIQNIGEKSANCTLQIYGDNEGNFSMNSPQYFRLEPNEKKTAELIFRPQTFGTKNAVFKIAGDNFESLQMQLYGVATSGTGLWLQLAIDTIFTRIGQEINIPVRVLSSSGFMLNKELKYEAELRYNGSILGFRDSAYTTRLLEPWRTITLYGSYTIKSNSIESVLCEAKLTAALGDTNATSIILDNLKLFDGNGVLHAGYSVRNGKVVITDADKINIPTDAALKIKAYPIPAVSALTLDIISPISKPVLTIYSIAGEIMSRQQLDIAPNKLQTISLSTERFGRGCYIVVLSSDTSSTAELCFIITP